MLDCVIEIPLPGRILATSGGASRTSAPRAPLPFVAGPENRLVAGTINDLLRSANRQKRDGQHHAPSLLALFGLSGTGKTHLAIGLVRYWQSQLGDDSAIYTTAAEFRHLLNDAVKRQTELAFRAEFRGRALLVMDDLQHLPADDHAWQELRYTLDDCEERGACVILTANESIASLANAPVDIRSRAAGGLALQLAAPGTAARVQIIRHAAGALDRSIADDVATRLARGIEGGANELFRALFELNSNTSESTDAAHADELLAARASRRPTIREIAAAVARHQNIPQSELKSSSRKQSTVFARGLVVYLAREISGASYDQIGRALGGRDHTTIIHNYRKIAGLRQTDPQTALAIDQLRHTLLTR
jgi:chromosomal replication initiator protein